VKGYLVGVYVDFVEVLVVDLLDVVEVVKEFSTSL
jgi:hypothetical protein